MPIHYTKLFDLIKQRGKTEYWLRQNGISPSILNKLKHETADWMRVQLKSYVVCSNASPATSWNTSQTTNKAGTYFSFSYNCAAETLFFLHG